MTRTCRHDVRWRVAVSNLRSRNLGHYFAHTTKIFNTVTFILIVIEIEVYLVCVDDSVKLVSSLRSALFGGRSQLGSEVT